jgi:hypothetical protein
MIQSIFALAPAKGPCGEFSISELFRDS